MRTIAVVDSSAQLGGAELSLLPIAERLAAEGRVVALLPSDGPLGERLLELGVELDDGFQLRGALARASRQYGLPGVAVLGAGIQQQGRLTSALRRIQPDVVYCNGFRAQVGATVPARIAGAAVVWHVRDFVPAGAAARVFGGLSTLTRSVIANSDATAAQPALAHAQPVVIPNGIDLTRFRPRAAEPAGPPRIGMAGHLTPWKGHERFLRVLERLRASTPGLMGTIAGAAIYDTADHDDYAARVRALAAEAGCELVSVVPEEMPAWLSGLTVFVHCPDRSEPFGRSLAEALAVGTPVVAAAAGGAIEVVGDAGIVLPQADETALHAAIVSLLADEKRRRALARAGIARAQERFDEATYADRAVAVVLDARC